MTSALKFSLQQSLGLLAKLNAEDAIALFAKSLPASVVSVNGAIATVKFEILSDFQLPQIDVPIAGSAYVREPLQAGDAGLLIPCGASIDKVSGLGDAVADLSAPPNLSAYTFFPIGNKQWKPVDSRMLTLTGLSDVLIRDDLHQVQLENIYASWVSLIAQLNALLLVIGPGLTTPTVLTPILDTTNPVIDRV